MAGKHNIKITTKHSASSYGCPVCLIGGNLVNDSDGINACREQLGWTQRELAERCGKSLVMAQKYCQGVAPVPAEVWLVLREALTGDGV
ncbi:helix-turn-helix domain-containing protein [Rubinisphaera brasiliensis]|uniref:Helix-turn-helix domain protein n=1 Tax=Rubinisphaera brasiliensis (strain ATCC 49424 / DSM 5305 / JCM 21570 / IAM 15109 / NBRC 103401 / IFAM 1448) TaxID=756272 RepID=F0SPG7_RUBBR|nr:helix-turn-helix transcriptional regulator [Rubinisphaera brasiliensis]ADY57871.1 helix-turn-helix domain protein [Rubinisphaera brasiliensis DSM 5305]